MFIGGILKNTIYNKMILSKNYDMKQKISEKVPRIIRKYGMS